ncbi:hypothetical protein BT96DRAFT_950333 [Gymnopus androsaceus JB14]|uniref:Uncharacterized protein n=1 Tax=Gymnopus androsaceus JB14 TaxID=1447944 RepID=A0A6A4GGW8_9AGAR|nr:hypothetical protein BT96DRAFT_950333 [Gymnopus androsaceus JB14]
MVSPSSLCSATRARNSVHHPAMPPQPPTEAALRAMIFVWNHTEKAKLGRKVASQANELVEVRGILAESPNVIATRFAELERQTAVLEAAHRINNAQLEHLQGVNDSNAFEVEHLLSKLSIADEAILGFREAFSNVEEHVVKMETLFKEHNHQIAELKAEKELIIDDLVQTFQVNVSLRSSLNKAYRDMGDLATSALLAHHADLKRPLRVIMHNVTIAHRGFETLCQFANEADTPGTRSTSRVSYVGFHGARAHDLLSFPSFHNDRFSSSHSWAHCPSFESGTLLSIHP